MLVRSLWFFAFRFYGKVMPWRLVPVLAALLVPFLRVARFRRKVAFVNLQYTLDMAPEERRRIERLAFRNLVRVYLEVPLLGHVSRQTLSQSLAVENLDLLSIQR